VESAHFLSTKPTTPLPFPNNFAATGQLNAIKLTWQAISNKSLGGYNLYRDGGATPINGATLISKTATSYTDSGLGDGEQHYYTVTAHNPAGFRDSAQAGPVTPLPTGPTTPTGLTATGRVGKVDLTWTAVTNLAFASYDIYRDGALLTQVTSISTTSYSDTAV